jgi:phosphoribulokinase
VEGLHPVAAEAVRRELDLSVYVDPSDQVRSRWKERRDIAERRMTPAEVRDSFEKEAKHFDAFVRPQRERADLVFGFEDQSPPRVATDDEDLAVTLTDRSRPGTARVTRARSLAAGRGLLVERITAAIARAAREQR